jgi:hypothetical protein
MKSRLLLLLLILLPCLMPARPNAQEPKPDAHTTDRLPGYSRWHNGPPAGDHFFPIAVWLQNPAHAARYKAAGINLYVGLWQGPTPQQLADLQQAGMSVICSQNQLGLQHKNNPVIVGWMHGDEPDNAQSLGDGSGYGPPVPPGKIIRDYEQLRENDPSRPVFLNLGQGVAWDDYIGRGVRRNHPEDYPLYVQGADIVSFDIYPVVHRNPEVAGKLEFVGRGVERLAEWAGDERIVWNCIECTHIGNAKVKPTPGQVRAEVWMSLIHGSRGLIYFVHQFEPSFKEAALLADPEMLAAVTAINRQIHALAPILNNPSIPDQVTATSGNEDASIAFMVKRDADATWLFTVNMRNRPTRGSFHVSGLQDPNTAGVLGESRDIPLRNGRFADDFAPYEVHLYRIGH